MNSPRTTPQTIKLAPNSLKLQLSENAHPTQMPNPNPLPTKTQNPHSLKRQIRLSQTRIGKLQTWYHRREQQQFDCTAAVVAMPIARGRTPASKLWNSDVEFSEKRGVAGLKCNADGGGGGEREIERGSVRMKLEGK